MTLKPQQAIGIFDSGVGGLTIANAIKNVLPQEKIIYFGDTAHLPYGDKSNDSIKYYSTKISEFLARNNVKAILIACNTASAIAYKAVKEHIAKINPEIIIINVIEPVIEYVTKRDGFKKIGVIGTKGTINSGTYPLKIIEKNSQIEVRSLATPLLASMIEEGFVYDDISNAIIRSYLSNEKLNNIDALILGCTHYPIIKNQIRKFYNFKTKVLDSSRIVAAHTHEILSENNLLNSKNTEKHEFYVSDYTEMFENISEMFFEDEVKFKEKNLWK